MSRTLLVLGGTAWVGRETARQALARGYDVTCLARGESGSVAHGATHVRVDRDAPDPYVGVAGRDWDAVVEVSWQPRHVREAAEALDGWAGHWTYVSSMSVYEPGAADESAPLADPVAHDEIVDITQYQGAKVRCEIDTLASAPEALLVRAGVIGGPGDPTDRFAYWPARAAIAGDGPMLVPGGATAAVQVIDVRDLVAWMLDASEDGVTGPVNAVGESVSLDDVVATARSVADASGPVVRADAEWLAAQEVRPWSGPDSLPLWIPDDGGPARLGASDGGRYLATGGHRRPIADTARDVLAEERVLGLDRDRRGGLTRERELELIAELNS